ncbi:isoprenylcysteine carboxylmethyltransferase family protein [Mycolicibacterium sp. 120270]|uniref:methyltransferase family protein n=1 Tax=Mycolicibacterium sp. 120270 TaxID=3090600 RepID=UPI00299EB558|nr:isoprenylcysteine carboxylmethyltransferase family protein [Mycolicibacterium sp. 120270]MDX1887705.1 isoprenylcysteine carboxylmethyltransferase family protein [Mycolicibacterium sp. 120270]
MKTALQMIGYTVFSVVFFAVLLFWPAGTFDYWQGWVFIAVFVIGTTVPTIYLAVKYPDAFRRRVRSGPFAESRMAQKLINIGIIATTVAAGVVSALDHRFGWSTVPTAVVVIGNVLVLAGLAVAEVVIIQNNYAAATITVEAEQPVVSTGLYGLVRHPMYVGALIVMVGMPLALASYWGLVALIPGVLVFAARITDEEKALRQELDGYVEYTQKVHYRLVPGVW